jgi:hypothetical protein
VADNVANVPEHSKQNEFSLCEKVFSINLAKNSGADSSVAEFAWFAKFFSAWGIGDAQQQPGIVRFSQLLRRGFLLMSSRKNTA